MHIIDKKGNASIELLYSALFLFVFMGFVGKFAILGLQSHEISIDLQNRVESIMIKKERVPCLDLQKRYFSKKTNLEFPIGKSIYKRLTLFDESICKVSDE